MYLRREISVMELPNRRVRNLTLRPFPDPCITLLRGNHGGKLQTEPGVGGPCLTLSAQHAPQEKRGHLPAEDCEFFYLTFLTIPQSSCL